MREPDLIIDPLDFPIFLKARMGTSTVAEFAAATGIHPKLIYQMLSAADGSDKGRAPSKDVLKKLNLKIAYVVDRSAPAKARAKKKE
jgi:hypothetical protein